VQEIWADIDGFENYQISNLGKVKSKERMVSNAVRTFLKQEQMLKTQIMKTGYRSIVIRDEKQHKHLFKIHRLVAQAFIPNPNNLPEVNHKDGDKLNCHVDNLEWCTCKENVNHAIRHGLVSPIRGRNIQKIMQLNCDDLSVNCVFENITDAAKKLGCNSLGTLYSALEERRSFKGFYYIRESDFSSEIDNSYFRKTKVTRYKILYKSSYISTMQYSNATGISRYKIYQMIKNGEIESEVI